MLLEWKLSSMEDECYIYMRTRYSFWLYMLDAVIIYTEIISPVKCKQVKAKFHYTSWFGASSELVPN